MPAAQQEDQWITYEQASDLTGKTPDALRQMVSRGKLDVRRQPGSNLRLLSRAQVLSVCLGFAPSPRPGAGRRPSVTVDALSAGGSPLPDPDRDPALPAVIQDGQGRMGTPQDEPEPLPLDTQHAAALLDMASDSAQFQSAYYEQALKLERLKAYSRLEGQIAAEVIRAELKRQRQMERQRDERAAELRPRAVTAPGSVKVWPDVPPQLGGPAGQHLLPAPPSRRQSEGE